MGRSKTYQGSPGFESQNTPRGGYKYSRGDIAKPEGTHMSGEMPTGNPRGKLMAGARDKSKSGKAPGRNSGPYGNS